THYPHYFEEDAQDFFGAPTYGAENFRQGGGVKIPAERLSEDDRRYADALYDGSLRYTDREIGRLSGFLRDQGWLDETVLAITADHGEHLLGSSEDGPRAGATVFSHGGAWLEPVARIPLILHRPGDLAPGHFSELSEGVDVAPTLLALAGVSLPAGKAFDGIDLGAVIAGRAAAKEQVLVRGGGIRDATHKALFAASDRVLLATSRPAAGKLKAVRRAGRLYDLVSDPGERVDLMAAEPGLAGALLDRYRRIMTAPYRRAEAARSSEQPSAAFAISVRHVRTPTRLPRVKGAAVPAGWSRLHAEPHSALIARATDQPLAVRFPIPDGRYRLNLGMVGRAMVEVNGRRRTLSSRGMVEFGDVEVTGGSFRATIHPRPDQVTRLLFFGFVPPGAAVDPTADSERLRRLKALGYVQ
ncbi:MAG: sulfatase-like hydrolase/transferase, partial [Thermoanaerobaculia bacterium]